MRILFRTMFSSIINSQLIIVRGIFNFDKLYVLKNLQNQLIAQRWKKQ